MWVEAKIVMNKSKILIILGVLCLVCSFGLFGYNYYEDYQAKSHVDDVIQRIAFKEADMTYKQIPEKQMSVSYVDDIGYVGILILEDFNLQLPIVANYDEALLKVAPCRFQGSVYLDDMIIAGHNYSSHFGKIGLLNYGCKITFIDMNNNKFHYVVSDILKIADYEYDKLVNDDYWDLTLFTCTLSRTSRIVIRCQKIEI